LDIFIRSLGFEPILSEQGDVAYAPDIALDESCYREVQNCDIYVLIIGGRYGSEISATEEKSAMGLYDRYQSVTKQEHKSAADKDIPVFVLIEKGVYAEYQTFKRNRDNKTISYAHVDSINIFEFIDEILSRPRNNPVYAFENHSDIESWLRDQWAGLFRELIDRMSGQQQLASLTAQVAQMAEINTTLKKYLEDLLSTESPEKSKELIESENQRLAMADKIIRIQRDVMIDVFMTDFELSGSDIIPLLEKSSSYDDFINLLRDSGHVKKVALPLLETYRHHSNGQRHWRVARTLLTSETAKDVEADDEVVVGPAPKRKRPN